MTSFKAPTPVELAHDFLWRVHAECPARGMIGIFNRSHYEDVVTVGVLGLEETARRFREFVVAYEAALSETSTEHAPWYVIPGDRNWVRNHAVATVLVEALRRLDPKYPY